MNLKTFGKKVGKGIKKNLPKILVCGSIAGMVTSVVFAVKAKGTWVDPIIMLIPGETTSIVAKGYGTVSLQAIGGWL